MDFREELFENKLKYLTEELTLVTKQMMLLQDFINLEFRSQFQSFCQSRRAGRYFRDNLTSTVVSNSNPTGRSSKPFNRNQQNPDGTINQTLNRIGNKTPSIALNRTKKNIVASNPIVTQLDKSRISIPGPSSQQSSVFFPSCGVTLKVVDGLQNDQITIATGRNNLPETSESLVNQSDIEYNIEGTEETERFDPANITGNVKLPADCTNKKIDENQIDIKYENVEEMSSEEIDLSSNGLEEEERSIISFSGNEEDISSVNLVSSFSNTFQNSTAQDTSNENSHQRGSQSGRHRMYSHRKTIEKFGEVPWRSNYRKLSNGQALCTFADCNKRFRDMNKFRRHFLGHTGIKPYKCTLCTAAYTRNDQLTRHKIKHFYEQHLSTKDKQNPEPKGNV